MLSLLLKRGHDAPEKSVLVWVEATWVLIVCHLEYLVDTPSSETKVGGESYHQPSDPVSGGVHSSSGDG